MVFQKIKTALVKTVKEGEFKILTYKNKNGKIKKVKRLLNGLLEGKQKFYNDKGSLVEIITFNRGIKEGKYTKFNDDGSKFIECTYSNGIKNGPFKKYLYADGFMVEEGNYDVEEKLTGNHISYLGKERIIVASGKFEKNKKIEIWKQFDKEGNLTRETNFYDVNSNKKKVKKFVIINGEAKLKSEINYVNKIIDGEFIEYHPNEKIARKEIYKQGTRIGIWRTYDQHGVVLKEVDYSK